MKFFDSDYNICGRAKGIEQYYPTRWPIELFKCINYFEEFPQNILLVSELKKTKGTQTIISKYGKSNDFDEIQLGDFLNQHQQRWELLSTLLLYSQNGDIGKTNYTMP